MKKLISIMLMTMLMIMSFGTKVYARDGQGCSTGQVLPRPNVRVVGAYLVWDAVDGAAGYQVWISGSTNPLPYEDTTETRFYMPSHSYLNPDSESYDFYVYSIADDPDCNSPLNPTPSVTGITFLGALLM